MTGCGRKPDSVGLGEAYAASSGWLPLQATTLIQNLSCAVRILPSAARYTLALRYRKAAFAHQGIGVDIPAAEVAERFVGRHRIADA